MLGEQVKIELIKKGISTTEAANFIGISEGNLYKLFKKDSFEIAYLQKIATLTERSLNYFIEFDNLGLETNQKIEKQRVIKTKDRPMQKNEEYSDLIASLKRENEILIKNNDSLIRDKDSLIKDKERLWTMVETTGLLGKQASNECSQIESNIVILDMSEYKVAAYKEAV